MEIVIFPPETEQSAAKDTSSTPTSYLTQTKAINEITVFRGEGQINTTASK